MVQMSLVAIKNEIVRIIKNIKTARLGTTIAVEAKISDWRNGIVQAQRYLLFSDYSYLLLPKASINIVDFKLLENDGIGLLADMDGVIEEIVAPPKSCECDYYLKYMHTSVLFDRYKKTHDKYIGRKDNVFSKYLLYSSC